MAEREFEPLKLGVERSDVGLVVRILAQLPDGIAERCQRLVDMIVHQTSPIPSIRSL